MVTQNSWSIPERIEFVQDGKLVSKNHTDNGRIVNTYEHTLKQMKAAVSSSETASKSGFGGSWVTPCSSTTLEWKSVFRTGKGLRNLGNTCFLNASLQSLVHCPPFATALLEKLFSKVSSCHSHTGYCSICAVEKTAQHIFSSDSSSKSYSPVELVRNLKALSRNFAPGRQADAHEFIRFLLDDMNRILLGIPRGKICHDRQQEMQTLVHEIFGGCYESKVSCQSCGSSSNTFEPFLDVSLDLEGVNTITKALKNFITPERLFGRNRYFCSQCKQKKDASKVFQFRRIPNVFIFHLKRFRFTRKETKFVSYDETLDFSSFMPMKDITDDNSLHYRLCAVVVHEGFSIHGGHYYAFVRNSNGIWYLKDDECTRQVGIQTVLQQRAYLLFYSCIAKEKTNRVKVENNNCSELQSFSSFHPKGQYPLTDELERKPQGKCKKREMSLIRFLRLQRKMRNVHGTIGLHIRNALNTCFEAQMNKNIASAVQKEQSVQDRKEPDAIPSVAKQKPEENQKIVSIPSPFSVGTWSNCSYPVKSRKELLSQEGSSFPVVKKRDWWDMEYDKGKQRKRRKRQNSVRNFSKYIKPAMNKGNHVSV